MNPERPSKKQSEHFLPSVGEFHIKSSIQWETTWKKEKKIYSHCRAVFASTASICTDFPVCSTLGTLPSMIDDQHVFLWDLWIHCVDLHFGREGLAQSTTDMYTERAYFSSVYNSQDFARWSLCVLEGAMNLLRRPPFCGQGWRRVVAQLRLWIQRYGVEFVCPLLCCEKLSGLTIPVLSFLFFLYH